MASYALTTSYMGESLLSGFKWFTEDDPSHGYVSYQSRPNAEALGLYSVDESTGVVRLGVDSTNTYSLGQGRPSIRLESKEAFTHGLFIADFLHMPPSQCGLWPAFWSYGPDWPAGGEVDIIEGANDQYSNIMSAHTLSGCSIDSNLNQKFLGAQRESSCLVGDNNVGCGYTSPASDTSAYGDGFNAANGGVYAMEWDDEFIKIWHFARSNIPRDITDKAPDPTSWGLPQALFGGARCNVDDFFENMNLVININFCGDWGNAIWGKTDGCGKHAATCNEYVANNPEAFANAYWDVRYIEAYQKTHAPSASPTHSSSAAESLTRVTMTTTITTTVTVKRGAAKTTDVGGRNATSGESSSYISASRVTTAGVTSVHELNATSSFASSARSSSASAVIPVDRLNSTSPSASSLRGSPVVNTTSLYLYKLNATSTLGSSHRSSSVNTTKIHSSTTSGSGSTQRILPTNTTRVPSYTVSSLNSISSDTLTDSSYKSKSQTAASPISTLSEVAAPKNPIQIGDFAYLGCYSSTDDFKTFHQAKDSKDMTIEMCTELCRDSLFSGVYDTQCFCADSLDADTRAANANNGEFCRHPCPGNVSQHCGGLAESLGRSANTSTPTGVQASKSTATGSWFQNATTGSVGKSSNLVTRFQVPSKRRLVPRGLKGMLLTVYGAVKDKEPPPPPPPMAGNNISYTITEQSTTTHSKTTTKVLAPGTVGTSHGSSAADKSPSASPIGAKTVTSAQATPSSSEDDAVVDEDPGSSAAGKVVPTQQPSDLPKDGSVVDKRPGGSPTSERTVLETAAPSSIQFVMGKRPGGSKTITKTVDGMVVVVTDDCGCTDGESHHHPVSAHEPIVNVPGFVEGSKQTQSASLPPSAESRIPQPAPTSIKALVPPESSTQILHAPAAPAEKETPLHPGQTDIEAPAPVESSTHTRPAQPPAHNPTIDTTVSLGNDTPAPVDTPGEIQHAPPSFASPVPPPPPPPPAESIQPQKVGSSGFESVPLGENARNTTTPVFPLVTAGCGRAWGQAKSVATMGLAMLAAAVLL
ncbi:hypothetical protein ED733_008264 [Metarhizium rileyi]|uniref:Uncharacterized protein n=1 Tax=Metarhizium rileyi (strain RCEF 4871) TaxID=1649241 RepID=A0A5C6GKT0_METRR|nr:hypothetical protein ED733_008264 [Metarhizium rileyi]